jgi:nitrogen regulatory protein PII
MKKVEAIIESFKIHDVNDALERAGVNHLKVSKVRETDSEGGCRDYRRGGKYEPKFSGKKIEFEVAEEALEKVLAAVARGMGGRAYGNERVSVCSPL